MLYFLQAGRNGPVKIGYSRDAATLKRRMAALSSGLPYEPKLLGVIEGAGRQAEQELHAQFSATRMRGEWFSPDAKLLEYICSHCALPEAASNACPSRAELRKYEAAYQTALRTAERKFAAVRGTIP